MKTKEYVKKFQLGDARFANHFNTNLFLEDFDQEFQERIATTIETRKKAQLDFNYHIFQILVGEMQNKFSAISNKKSGGPLRKELWSAFYAKSIIPARAKYFPEEHAAIEKKREIARLMYEEEKAQKQDK